jgi:hypothetical protein
MTQRTESGRFLPKKEKALDPEPSNLDPVTEDIKKTLPLNDAPPSRAEVEKPAVEVIPPAPKTEVKKVESTSIFAGIAVGVVGLGLVILAAVKGKK